MKMAVIVPILAAVEKVVDLWGCHCPWQATDPNGLHMLVMKLQVSVLEIFSFSRARDNPSLINQ